MPAHLSKSSGLQLLWSSSIRSSTMCRAMTAHLVTSLCACRTALFNLEEYESAKDAFEAGLQLDPQSSAFKTWVRKCDAEMEGGLLAKQR